MFQGSFRGLSREFQGSFISGVFVRSFEETSKKVSKQFLGKFRRVLRNFQGDSRYFKSVAKKFQGVLRKLQGYFKEMSKVFQ